MFVHEFMYLFLCLISHHHNIFFVCLESKRLLQIKLFLSFRFVLSRILLHLVIGCAILLKKELRNNSINAFLSASRTIWVKMLTIHLVSRLTGFSYFFYNEKNFFDGLLISLGVQCEASDRGIYVKRQRRPFNKHLAH